MRFALRCLIGLTYLLTAAFAAPSRADQRNPAVVIDSWWSGDYAKNGCEAAKAFMNADTRNLINEFGCESVTACPEVMPRFLACTTGLDPKAQAYQFEDRLITQFAINPGCKGVTFARYGGPNAKPPSPAEQAIIGRPHWALIVDYDVGSPKQSWSLQYGSEGQLLQNESATEEKVASDVCAIVLGQGGAFVR